MKKELIFIIVSIFILALILGIIFNKYQNKDPRVCFKENCFFVEIALTEEEKAEGLMSRGFLEEDKGMIFIYNQEGNYSFWMKNTLIALDIIWINSKKEVVYIEHEAQPCNENCEILSPGKNARYVLEINSGLAEKLNINIGDEVNFYIGF